MQEKNIIKKEKKEYYSQNIGDKILIDVMDKTMLFKVPSGGIHKPVIWRTKNGNWGLNYRVYATNNIQNITSKKKRNCLAISVKWKNSKNALAPMRGYEEFVATIPNSSYGDFRKLYTEMPQAELPKVSRPFNKKKEVFFNKN
jgi:hypothetical protein